MRNTTDDPKWTSAVYHDHVSWFPGGSYPVEKLFREHYAECYLGSATGVFHDLPDRKLFFNKISTEIPSEWQPGSVDAIATASEDGQRLVIKAVNYRAGRNTLLVRLQGKSLPEKASVKVHSITANLTQTATLERADVFTPLSRSMPYSKELTLELEPYSVAVLEVRAE